MLNCTLNPDFESKHPLKIQVSTNSKPNEKKYLFLVQGLFGAIFKYLDFMVQDGTLTFKAI